MSLQEFYRDKFNTFLEAHLLEETSLGDTCRLLHSEILDKELYMPKTMRQYIQYLSDNSIEEIEYDIEEFINEFTIFVKYV